MFHCGVAVNQHGHIVLEAHAAFRHHHHVHFRCGLDDLLALFAALTLVGFMTGQVMLIDGGRLAAA